MITKLLHNHNWMNWVNKMSLQNATQHDYKLLHNHNGMNWVNLMNLMNSKNTTQHDYKTLTQPQWDELGKFDESNEFKKCHST